MSTGAAPDLAAAATPSIGKAAAGVLGGAGALGLLSVFQTYANLAYISSTYQAILGAIALASLAAIITAVAFSRARAWAVFAAPYVAVLCFIASATWVVLAFRAGGVVTLFGFLDPALSVVGATLAVVARGPMNRAAAARERLRREGLDLGL